MTLSERVVVVLAFAVVLAPIAVFPLGVGRDYPAHLARVHIEANIGSDLDLQANYELTWKIVPHSALDVIHWFAASGHTIFGGQLFVAATLALMLLGTLAIHRALFGQISLWPLIAVIAMSNRLLEWGFIEYLFSIGLVLNCFALWIISARWSPARRVPFFSLLSLAMFWAHVLGFLVFGLLIAAFELWRVLDAPSRSWRAALRDWGWASVQFVIPLAMLAIVVLTNEGHDTGGNTFGGVRDRGVAILSPTLFYNPVLAFAIGGLFTLVVVVGWRTRWLEWDPRMRGPLVALAVASAVMPTELLGVWGIHFRYPVLLLLLVIAAARVRTPSPLVQRWFVITLLSVVAVQQVNVWTHMHRINSVQSEVRTALRTIEPGTALLLGAEGAPPCPTCKPVWADVNHVEALAVIERSAFVPGLWADLSRVQPSQSRQPMQGVEDPLDRSQLADGAARPPALGTDEDEAERYWDGWPETFDYLLWIHGGETGSVPAPGLRRIAGGATFDLYAIEPTAPATGTQR